MNLQIVTTCLMLSIMHLKVNKRKLMNFKIVAVNIANKLNILLQYFLSRLTNQCRDQVVISDIFVYIIKN